jgi:cytochrome c-type biogenesis protein
MDQIFTRLSTALQGSGTIALLAALAWGALSVLLSPCHLATIPLIVGFVGGAGAGAKRDKPAVISGLFALGMFLALAVVGGLVAVLGQAQQGFRQVGSYATAIVLLAAGLHLLGLIPLPLTGLNVGAIKRKGRVAALSAGLFLGIGLSPCTFAFLAPVLGAGLGAAASSAVFGFALLLAFAVGHCSVIAIAGASTGLAQRYLDWNERSRGPAALKAVCGVLLLLGAGSLVYMA